MIFFHPAFMHVHAAAVHSYYIRRVVVQLLLLMLRRCARYDRNASWNQIFSPKVVSAIVLLLE